MSNELQSVIEARITFLALNFGVSRRLICDPFEFYPRALDDDEARLLNMLYSRRRSPIPLALGHFRLEPRNPDAEGWQQFLESAIAMELLLSFAHRSMIQFAGPTWEVRRDEAWETVGWHRYPLAAGGGPGASWYGGLAGLEGFLQRSYPKIMDRPSADATGLRLALAYYREIHSRVPIEIAYMNTWTAFEILWRRNSVETRPLPKTTFRSVARQMQHFVDELISNGLADDAGKMLKTRIPELNRTRQAYQAKSFTDEVFASYPTQDVRIDELGTFFRLRHGLVHAGSATSGSDSVDATRIEIEQMRLKALLERVILAMLNEHPNLMNFSWRHWVYSA
jgi:hypothetical protein